MLLTALFRRVRSNLHVEYPWAQSSVALTLTLKLLALALASKASGLDLDNAVLEHIPARQYYVGLQRRYCYISIYARTYESRCWPRSGVASEEWEGNCPIFDSQTRTVGKIRAKRIKQKSQRMQCTVGHDLSSYRAVFEYTVVVCICVSC